MIGTRLQLLRPNGPRVIDGVFSLDRFEIWNDATTRRDRALEITTPPIEWAYAGIFPRSDVDFGDAASVAVTVALRVENGRVAVGLGRHDGKAISNEKIVSVSSESKSITFYADDVAEFDSITIRNATSDVASVATVDDIRVVVADADDESHALGEITKRPFVAHADRSDVFEFGSITTTEVCNLSCVMCHFNGPKVLKKDGVLAPELVEKTLREMEPGREVWFAATGEFFMDPNAVTYLRRARDLGLRPCVLSNGTLMTPELLDDVLDAGVRFVRFSADSTDPAEFRKIRRGAELSQITDACEYLKAKKAEYPDLRVEINCTLIRTTFPKQEAMIEFWRGKVDQINFNAEYHDTFTFRNTFFTPKRRNDCRIATYVMPSGYIAPCCAVMVYQHENDVSWLPHIAETSLQEAYDTLCDMYEDPQSPLAEICRSCDWWIMWAEGEDGTPYLRCVPLDDPQQPTDVPR